MTERRLMQCSLRHTAAISVLLIVPACMSRTTSMSQGELTDFAIFHWTWTGTNTGPGGTGVRVQLSGYERWTIGVDGLVAESKGHSDAGEYQRQVSGQ